MDVLLAVFCKKQVFTAYMAFSSSELFFFFRDGSEDDRPVLGASAADELGVMGCTDLSPEDVSGISSPSSLTPL